MLRIVVDTNIWIRILLGGTVTLPILQALREDKFQCLISHPLIEELKIVSERPRLKKHINPLDAEELLELLLWKSTLVEVKTIPPHCRDPKDQPVLATAIDGKADGIVTGDDDLRADEELRDMMGKHNIKIWGVQSFFDALEKYSYS